MTDEVEFLTARIRDEYGAGSLPAGHTPAGEDPPPLEIMDADESTDTDGVEETRVDPTRTNVVKVGSVDESPTPIGAGYDHRLQTITEVEVGGLDEDKLGWVGTSQDRAPWGSLKRVIRRAVLRARSYPDVGRPDVAYHSLGIVNPADNSRRYADSYALEFDVEFTGVESLP